MGRPMTTFTGVVHKEELQFMLNHIFMIRRLKKEILTDLPPKSRSKFILCENEEQEANMSIGNAFEQVQDVEDMPSKSNFEKEEQEMKMQESMIKLYGATSEYKKSLVTQ